MNKFGPVKFLAPVRIVVSSENMKPGLRDDAFTWHGQDDDYVDSSFGMELWSMSNMGKFDRREEISVKITAYAFLLSAEVEE